jgi:hypothetical protein
MSSLEESDIHDAGLCDCGYRLRTLRAVSRLEQTFPSIVWKRFAFTFFFVFLESKVLRPSSLSHMMVIFLHYHGLYICIVPQFV